MATEKDIDIYAIDFDWVKKTDKVPQLKKALKILEQDGIFFFIYIMMRYFL